MAAARVFGLGYFDFTEVSPFYDRLMIPLRSVYGDLLSFQGRALYDYAAENKPKYYHQSFEKSSILYGLYENAEWIWNSGYAVMVEGPLDVISLYDANVPAFALLGTTFCSGQAWLIRRYTDRTISWLDDDAAGQKATELAQSLLTPLGMRMEFVSKHRSFKDAGETWQKAGFDGIRRVLNELSS